MLELGVMDLDYTYVEGQALFGDLDGFRAEGSYRLADHFDIGEEWFVAASFEAVSLDIEVFVGGAVNDTIVDTDVDVISVWGGYIVDVQEDVDLVLTFGLERGEASGFTATQGSSPDGVIDQSETGVRLGAQARFLASEDFELNGGLLFRQALQDVGQEIVFGVGVVWEFLENVRAVGDIQVTDDGTLFGIGVRYGI